MRRVRVIHQHRISTQLTSGKIRSIKSDKESVIVLGSGHNIRIGQGFDYATVHSVNYQAAGYEAIIMNSNPGTVSTDSVSDKLHFPTIDLRRRDERYRIGTT